MMMDKVKDSLVQHLQSIFCLLHGFKIASTVNIAFVYKC